MTETIKPTFKIGDRVRIVTPNFFYRVGYPLTAEQVIAEFTDEEKEAISKVYGMMQRRTPTDRLDWGEESILDFNPKPKHEGERPQYNPVLYHLAQVRVRACHYGGNKREIHVKTEESLRGRIGRVHGKRQVLTGIRAINYEDDYSYTTLDCRQNHTILEIELLEEIGGRTDWLNAFGALREIEACHVEFEPEAA